VTNSSSTISSNIDKSSSSFNSEDKYALDTSNALRVSNKLDKSDLSTNNATNKDNERSIYSYNLEN